MKYAFIVILLLSSMASAESSDKTNVLKLLINNKDIHVLNIVGQPMTSTVGDFLAEALTEENITIAGLCHLDKASFHYNCALDITSRSANGLRKGYTFSFERVQDIIINNKVTVIIGE